MPTIPAFTPNDTAQNPILLPDERWEDDCIERMWVLVDEDGETMRGWFTAAANANEKVGLAMSHAQTHFPMHGEFDSEVHDCTSQRTGCTVTFQISDEPTGTSAVLWYRSSATSAADCLAQDWTLWTSGTVTLERYAQFRVSLRTLDPLSSPAVDVVRFYKSGFNWYSDGSSFMNGTYYEGMDAVNLGVLRLAMNVPPLGWTKYWANPVIEGTDDDGWRGYGVSAGAVIKDGSTYKMWVNGRHNTEGWRIGYCTSADGISWTFGNGDAPLDFYGDETLDYCADSLVLKEADGFHLWCVHARYAGVDTIIHTRSDDGVTAWDAPTAFYTAESPNIPVAISGLKVGSRYHFWWEELRGVNWKIVHGSSSNKAGPIQPADTEIAVNPSGIYGDWREKGAATPCFIALGDRIYGFIKGFSTRTGAVTSGYVPDPSTQKLGGRRLVNVCSAATWLPLAASDTYVGAGFPVLVPGPCWLQGFLIEVGAPEKEVSGTASISGAKTAQVAMGTAGGIDGTLSGTDIDILLATALDADTAGIHGQLASQYASAYWDGPGGTKYFPSGATVYLNVIMKAATVDTGTPGDKCNMIVPIRVYAIVDQSAGYR